MSIEAFTWALTSKGIRDAARKLVLAGLANHAHKDGRNAWASKATLAEYVECDPKTVSRHLKVLLAEGWIREGDQEQVAHLRADRRPVVYDLAMSEATRLEWKADRTTQTAADTTSGTTQGRGDNLSPRPETGPVDNHAARGDNLSTRDTSDGGTHGGTNQASRGDTAVSPKPYEPINLPPNPPASQGATARRCTRHPTGQQPNCRGCGTTPRQIEARKARDAAAQRRAEHQKASQESRARTAAAGRTPASFRQTYQTAKAST